MKRIGRFAILMILCLSMVRSVLPTVTFALTSGDFEYEKLKDGTVEITGYTGSARVRLLEIPDTLDGKTVTTIADRAFSCCHTIEDVVIPESVTTIGAEAFSSCSALESVSVPESVKEIGTGAFSGCVQLTTISVADKNPSYRIIDASLYTKDGETLMQFIPKEGETEVILPDSVTSIEAYAFSDCASLRRIVLPSALRKIETRTFQGCTALESIEIPYTVTDIESYAFYHCDSLKTIEIHEGVRQIGEGVFAECTSLERATIPDTQEVLDGTFSGCTALQSITIPDSVRLISDFTFHGCSSLQTVTIPNGVEEIRMQAFSDCTALESITIPDSVVSIEESALIGCPKLTDITVGENNATYTVYQGHLFTKDKTALLRYVPKENEKDAVIPEGTARIGNYAFHGCDTLQSVTFPSSLKEIGSAAFEHCTSLKEVALPEGLTNIASETFYGCTALERVTIPKSVTAIERGAFNYCDRLTEVQYDGTDAEWASIRIEDGNDALKDDDNAVGWIVAGAVMAVLLTILAVAVAKSKLKKATSDKETLACVCPQCGWESDQFVEFCGQCGTRIDGSR